MPIVGRDLLTISEPRYASPALAASPRESARRIASFAGLTYAQLLVRLQGVEGSPA